MYVVHVINHTGVLVKVFQTPDLKKALDFKKENKALYERIYINKRSVSK